MFTNVLNLMRHAGGACPSKVPIRGRGRKFPYELPANRVAFSNFPADFSLNAPRLKAFQTPFNETHRV